MSMYQEITLKLLANYALLYVKVGKIELALRELIPATFSNPHTNRGTHWGDLLIFNTSYKKNPHSRKSFHIVNRLLFESRTIRNRVAHFDFPEGIDIEVDSRNLDELLRLLDR